MERCFKRGCCANCGLAVNLGGGRYFMCSNENSKYYLEMVEPVKLCETICCYNCKSMKFESELKTCTNTESVHFGCLIRIAEPCEKWERTTKGCKRLLNE